jgi:hypothetical protein
MRASRPCCEPAELVVRWNDLLSARQPHVRRSAGDSPTVCPPEHVWVRKAMTEEEVTPEILGVLRSMDLFKGKDPDQLFA